MILENNIRNNYKRDTKIDKFIIKIYIKKKLIKNEQTNLCRKNIIQNC